MQYIDKKEGNITHREEKEADVERGKERQIKELIFISGALLPKTDERKKKRRVSGGPTIFTPICSCAPLKDIREGVSGKMR